MEIRWSPRAAEDLERIFHRIEKDNPNAARKVVMTIYHGCCDLKFFPNRGRPSRIPGRREFCLAACHTSWCTGSNRKQSRFPVFSTRLKTGLRQNTILSPLPETPPQTFPACIRRCLECAPVHPEFAGRSARVLAAQNRGRRRMQVALALAPVADAPF